MDEHVSHLQLDGLRLNALPADELAQVRSHVGGCDHCRATADAIEASAAAFATEFRPAQLASDTLDRASKRRWSSWWAPRLQPLASAAAVALVVVTAVSMWPTDSTRIKGAGAPAELFVGEQSVRGAVPVGSTLRLRFDPGEATFVQLWWRDGGGALTPLAAPMTAATPGARWLDRPIELDDDPRSEALLVLMCRVPVDDPRGALDGSVDACDVHELAVDKRGP